MVVKVVFNSVPTTERAAIMGIMVHGDADARVPRPLRSHLHVDPFHGHLSGMGMAEAMEGDAGQAHGLEQGRQGDRFGGGGRLALG